MTKSGLVRTDRNASGRSSLGSVIICSVVDMRKAVWHISAHSTRRKRTDAPPDEILLDIPERPGRKAMGQEGRELMSSLVQYPIIVIAVGATTLVSYWLRLRSKPRELVDGGGRIVPGRRTIGIGVAAGLLLSAMGCMALWYRALVPGSLMAAAGLGGALLVALSLSRRHDVVWNGIGIEGPCRMVWGILGSARLQIRWSEITLTGRTMSGYAFVEAAGGGRIYWNNLYSGFAVFENSLRLHRPDLFGNEAARRPSGTTTRENIGPRNANPARPFIERHDAPAPDDDG
jgi:hypothetical protein